MLLRRTLAFGYLRQSMNGHSNRRATHCAFLTRTYIIIKSTCRRYHNNTHTWSRIVMIRTNYLMVVCVISITASPLLLLPSPVRHALTTPEKRFIPPLYFILLYYYWRRIFFLLTSLYYCYLFPFSCMGTIIYIIIAVRCVPLNGNIICTLYNLRRNFTKYGYIHRQV